MAVLLNPYLSFKDNTREVMAFYQSVLGGELSIMTFGEGMPPDRVEERTKDLVMHARLETDDLTIMASDAAPVGQVVEGTNVSLSLSGPTADAEKLRSFFDGLSAGGKVTQPLEPAPWGDEFGMFTDRFGIYWMVNIGESGQA